jgi:hypothetical protein
LLLLAPRLHLRLWALLRHSHRHRMLRDATANSDTTGTTGGEMKKRKSTLA